MTVVLLIGDADDNLNSIRRGEVAPFARRDEQPIPYSRSEVERISGGRVMLMIVSSRP